MGFRSLAEAVILQSMEDLWDPQYRTKSREFFQGEGFRIYAKIADLSIRNDNNLKHFGGGRKHGRTVGGPGS